MATVDTTGPGPEKPPTRVLDFLAETGELTTFSGEAIAEIRRVPRFGSEALRQAAILIKGSTLYIGLLSIFIGFAVVSVGYFFLRSAGAADYLGAVTGIFTPRGSGAIMFGYAFAAKVGCGLTAEIGAMRIGDEIDAYESEGVNPMAYVVATRVVGALLFIPLAVVVVLLGVTFGGYVSAVVVLEALPGASLMHDHWAAQSISDQFFAALDMGTQAVVIVIVACFFGYRASGGPAGVGSAVAKSLVVNLVLVHVIVTGYTVLFYGQDVGLPIGG